LHSVDHDIYFHFFVSNPIFIETLSLNCFWFNQLWLSGLLFFTREKTFLITLWPSSMYIWSRPIYI
jgi:hypothetical protein